MTCFSTMMSYLTAMLCHVCKIKEATVFLTQIIEGSVEKLNLCEACSKTKGVHDPEGFALADLLLGLGGAQEMDKASPLLCCPNCGFSQADFKKRGRLGCSVCYDTFSEGLAVMLRTMHRDVIHIGKVPVKIAAAHQRAIQLETVRKSLEKAINRERYEEAALYRDIIQRLESEALTHPESISKNYLAVAQELLPLNALEKKATPTASSQT